MKLARILADLLRPSARPAGLQVALAPITNLPHPPRHAVNPLLLRGLYRD
jgi:hypothetical protein